ncbi:putative ribonuclease H-like domain-containing protein [Tanacetum coccineum]
MEHRGIFDSGCSGHMTGNRAHLEDYQEQSKVGSVTFGGSKGSISGKGTIRLGNLVFDDVAFVKELGHFNLFSISQICDKKLNVLFTEKECFVVSSDFKMPDENQVLLKVPRQHNMYTFDMKNVDSSKGYTCLLAKASSNEAKLWHRRLGHLNFKNLNKLVKDNLVRGLPSKSFKNDHTCVACQKGKQHKASCKAKIDRYVTHPLHTLHMDLFGPTSVRSINHASYCLVITDDCSRFCWVFFLAKKDETSDILKTFIRQIENQLNQKVKIIRSDNGTEFKNRVMLEFCGEKGIKQEFSNARTPQQNGVAERMNRTLIEAARTMLADSLLPTTFWAEAVNTACYTFNRVRVTKPQNKTPYELLFGHKPILSYIRPFGCHVTILNTLSPLGKFDGKSDEGFLVGYSVNSKAFRVYNLVTKRVEVNLHVNFLEEKPNVQGIGHRWMFDLDYLTDSMNYIPVSLQNQANPAGSKEVIDIDVQTEEDADLMVVSSTSLSEKIATKKTHSPRQPSSTPISKSADDIMTFRKELDALALKHLGPVPTTVPTSTNPVNTGSINLNPAFEKVNTGNTEAISPSADHEEEVFSDADDDEMPEIRIYDKSSEGIFEKASYDDEGIISDFNNLPDEVDVPTNPTLRIHNAHPQSQILGDPNTPVQTRSSLKKITEAHALVSYIQANQRSNHKDQQHCLFACFLSQFEPRKVSEALEDGSWVEAMQEELLQFKLQQVWVLVDLPNGAKVIGTKWPLTKDEEAFDVDVHLYRSMIGSLMYLTASRPDIMYAVCVCSRFQVSPKTSHLNAVKRIFKYLKGKPNLGLWYPRDSPLDLEAFSDSDYGGSNLDRKSTTGGCQFLGQRLISWQCKKQTIVATSTTEAEYVAAAHCCGQVLWVQNQLLDYGFNFMNTKIHIDNESTICIVKNPVYHSKTKHIEIRHHFIRDCYEKKLISVEKIHTDLNVADLLTKPFDGPRFNYLVVSIGTTWCLKRVMQDQLGHGKESARCHLKLDAIWLYTSVFEKRDADSTWAWKRCAGVIEIDAIWLYALTHNSTYLRFFLSAVWQTATARTLADGTQQLNATIDTIEHTITEESVRRQLQLADASGIHMLQNEEIFEGLQNIGPLLPVMLTIDAGQPQSSADPTPSQSVPATSSSQVQITPTPPTVTHSVQPTATTPPTQPVQTTTPPTQPVQTTSPPPVSTIPDIQPTLPPSPQIPSPSYHDTEGPSFEPSYHMSPPPSHEPEIQASISSEESEQLRNLMDIVPRLESRVKSLEKELKTDQGDTFVTPEKSKGSGEAQEEQISPSTLEAAQILTIVASEGFKGSQAPLGSKIYKRKSKSTKTPTKILHFEEPDSAQVNTAQVNTAELNPDSTPSAQINTGEVNAAEVNTGEVNAAEVNTGEVNAAEVNTGEVNAAEVNTGEAERAQRRKGKEPMTEEDLQAEVQASKTSKELQELADLEEAKRVQAEMDVETQRQIDLDALLARRLQGLIDSSDLAEKISTEERETLFCEGKEQSSLHDSPIARPKGSFLAEQKDSFEEIQVLYERYKKQDQTFVAIGSEEDERAIKKMNEKDDDKEEEKKDESVHEEAQEEEGAKKRKEDDDLKICLHISPDEDKVIDVESLDHQYPIIEWQSFFLYTNLNMIKPNLNEDIYSEQRRFEVIYEVVMEEYKDRLPEGFDRMLWGDLMIMFNQGDTADFWDTQQDWKLISWKHDRAIERISYMLSHRLVE